MESSVLVEIPANSLSKNVREGNTKVVKFLIRECGLSTELLTYDDVFRAVVNGHVKTFKFLLNVGISHILTQDDGWFFSWAVVNNKLGLVKLLVEKGAKYTTHYDRAFGHAVHYNYKEVVAYISTLYVNNDFVSKKPIIKLHYFDVSCEA